MTRSNHDAAAVPGPLASFLSVRPSPPSRKRLCALLTRLQAAKPCRSETLRRLAVFRAAADPDPMTRTPHDR